MTPDYYELLQIAPDASPEEVHKAYRTLAMRFHPDRNALPAAAVSMVVINEAYSVLNDPVRRRCYDQERKNAASVHIAAPILQAASETLLKQGWIASHSDGVNMTMGKGSRSVRVSLVPHLDNVLLRKIGRQAAGFSVVLSVEIETPLNFSFHTAVIDLMHSRHHGAAFPDEVYKALFAPFLP